MTPTLNALLNQIVFLEAVDAHHLRMNARRYQTAARSVRQIVESKLGVLDMRAFATAVLPSLQTTAENIFFDSHRRFADLEGRSDASRAHEICDCLMQRLGRRRP